MNSQFIIKIVLGIIILFLGYKIVMAIREPIMFEKERDRRYASVIERLKDIRKAQFTYRDAKGEFADDFDKLIDFIKTEDLTIIKTIGSEDDSTVVVVRDTIVIPVIDTLFPNNYPVDSLRYVPFTDGAKFEIAAGKVKKGGITINVFEVSDSAPFDPKKKLKVGSMSDANFSGNWE
jgi:hypothetical protein